MRVLVWQWGRHGAGPRFAAELARNFAAVPETEPLLSLAAGAEILRSAVPPACDLPFPTYEGLAGFAVRALSAPSRVPRLAAWLRDSRVDVALCAMPAPLDLLMAAALRRAGVPFAVVIHDADLHPGDAFPLQIRLQRRLMRHADGFFALSTHVADRLQQQRIGAGRLLATASLPPFAFGERPLPPGAHGGRCRLLSFGRLLPYKGLDLLADSLMLLGPRPDLEMRVVGSGPESPVLDALRAMPGVSVENRWVPEDEVGALLGWADGLVLSHREASQSGVAAAAVAAQRWVVATRVGGLEEQLRHEPMALMCDPTPASLAAAMARLLAGQITPPLGTNDCQSAWSGVANAMLTELRTLVRHPRRNPLPLPKPLTSSGLLG
jgi:glycosyltransferase involved in cell wall biosynthesis